LGRVACPKFIAGESLNDGKGIRGLVDGIVLAWTGGQFMRVAVVLHFANVVPVKSHVRPVAADDLVGFLKGNGHGS
jgi:hypothetical protein